MKKLTSEKRLAWGHTTRQWKDLRFQPHSVHLQSKPGSTAPGSPNHCCASGSSGELLKNNDAWALSQTNGWNSVGVVPRQFTSEFFKTLPGGPGAQGKLRRTAQDQCFSDLKVHTNPLGISLKCRLWFSGSGGAYDSAFQTSSQWCCSCPAHTLSKKEPASCPLLNLPVKCT